MIEVTLLTSPDCPHAKATLRLIQDVLADTGIEGRIERISIATAAEARLHRFPGSPTVRVQGMDVEPGRDFGPASFSLACRLYHMDGRLKPIPSQRMMQDSVEMADLVESGFYHGCC